MPVVCCSLHSQLAPVCAALAGRRVAYVQLGGGALPVSLSDAVRALKARRLLETAIAVAPCLDGDVAVRHRRLGAHARGRSRRRRRRLRDRPGHRRHGVPLRARRARRRGRGERGVGARRRADRRAARVVRRRARAPPGRFPSHALGARPLPRRGAGRMAAGARARRTASRSWRSTSTGWETHAGRSRSRTWGAGRRTNRGSSRPRSRPVGSRRHNGLSERCGIVPRAVRIGVAKEIKSQEHRVALTPAGALELVRRGHDVVVEEGAGPARASRTRPMRPWAPASRRSRRSGRRSSSC